MPKFTTIPNLLVDAKQSLLDSSVNDQIVELGTRTLDNRDYWENNNFNESIKLIDILSHDVQRIERLITDYSQVLKDEVALSKEKIRRLDIEPIVKSVVDDFNSIYKLKRGIKIISNCLEKI